MKRHDSLVILSREHHFGLLFCWKIRQGIQKQVAADRILSYVKYFWENNLKKHFEEEETILFTAMRDKLVDQAISEHRHIEHLIEMAMKAEATDTAHLNRLVDAVDDHVRFEERVLFPHMEKELSADKLVAVGEQLKQLHQEPLKDDYEDEFWK